VWGPDSPPEADEDWGKRDSSRDWLKLAAAVAVIGLDPLRLTMISVALTVVIMPMIVLPFLGVLVYLIANGTDMAKRDLEHAQAARAEFDDYVKSTAGSGGPAAEIDKAKQLLDSGAITQAEFDAIKAKALAQA